VIKYCFMDIETTGTDPLRHGVFQIAGIIRYGRVRDTFKFNCDVFKETEFDEKGMLESNGFTPKQIMQFPDPFEIYQKLTAKFGEHVGKFDKQDKMLFLGYGAEFDYKFMRQWFIDNGDQYFGSWFWTPWIDVMILAAEYLKNERYKLPNFKLTTIAERFGLIKKGEENFHDALYDIEITEQIYDIVTQSK
jgi:DNA polymerase III subunit epsilon